MIESSPIVTVLMPVYNAEKYLAEAINSILNQTFTNYELLIINDGSTDKSEEIILKYSDKRIRYIKNDKNIRLVATLNKGIELAKGKYIARMDADDISVPTRLEKQITLLENNEDIGVCGSFLYVFGENIRNYMFDLAFAFEAERHGHDTDGQNTQFLRLPGNFRSGSGTRPSPHSGSNKHHPGIMFENRFDKTPYSR